MSRSVYMPTRSYSSNDLVKTAQARGLVDRFIEATYFGGRRLESKSTVFGTMMNELRNIDNKIRATLLNKTISKQTPYPNENMGSAEELLKNAQSAYDSKEYLLAISYLEQFYVKVLYCAQLLKNLDSIVAELNKEYYKSLLEPLKEDQIERIKKFLKDKKEAEYLPEDTRKDIEEGKANIEGKLNVTTSARHRLNKKAGFYKQAGLISWVQGLFNPREAALTLWERIQPGASKDLKRDIGRVLSASNRLFNVFKNSLETMSSARANREIAKYQTAAKTIPAQVNSYSELVNDANFNKYTEQLNEVLASIATPQQAAKVQQNPSPNASGLAAQVASGNTSSPVSAPIVYSIGSGKSIDDFKQDQQVYVVKDRNLIPAKVNNVDKNNNKVSVNLDGFPGPILLSPDQVFTNDAAIVIENAVNSGAVSAPVDASDPAAAAAAIQQVGSTLAGDINNAAAEPPKAPPEPVNPDNPAGAPPSGDGGGVAAPAGGTLADDAARDKDYIEISHDKFTVEKIEKVQALPASGGSFKDVTSQNLLEVKNKFIEIIKDKFKENPIKIFKNLDSSSVNLTSPDIRAKDISSGYEVHFTCPILVGTDRYTALIIFKFSKEDVIDPAATAGGADAAGVAGGAGDAPAGGAGDAPAGGTPADAAGAGGSGGDLTPLQKSIALKIYKYMFKKSNEDKLAMYIAALFGSGWSHKQNIGPRKLIDEVGKKIEEYKNSNLLDKYVDKSSGQNVFYIKKPSLKDKNDGLTTDDVYGIKEYFDLAQKDLPPLESSNIPGNLLFTNSWEEGAGDAPAGSATPPGAAGDTGAPADGTTPEKKNYVLTTKFRNGIQNNVTKQDFNSKIKTLPKYIEVNFLRDDTLPGGKNVRKVVEYEDYTSIIDEGSLLDSIPADSPPSPGKTDEPEASPLLYEVPQFKTPTEELPGESIHGAVPEIEERGEEEEREKKEVARLRQLLNRMYPKERLTYEIINIINNNPTGEKVSLNINTNDFLNYLNIQGPEKDNLTNTIKKNFPSQVPVVINYVKLEENIYTIYFFCKTDLFKNLAYEYANFFPSGLGPSLTLNDQDFIAYVKENLPAVYQQAERLAKNASFTYTLQALSNESPIIVASFIRRYANLIQNKNKKLSNNLHKIASRIK